MNFQLHIFISTLFIYGKLTFYVKKILLKCLLLQKKELLRSEYLQSAFIFYYNPVKSISTFENGIYMSPT